MWEAQNCRKHQNRKQFGGWRKDWENEDSHRDCEIPAGKQRKNRGVCSQKDSHRLAVSLHGFSEFKAGRDIVIIISIICFMSLKC